ncbi:hypothetical protein Tco_1047058 [Tanacetum coccineum]
MQLNQEIFQKDSLSNNQNALEFLEYFENNDLKAQLQAKDTTIYKLKEHIKSMRENDKEKKVKHDMDEIETINIELEHSVAKLLSENERVHKEIKHLKKIYKDQFDSIKKTRALSKEHDDSLIAQLNSKSMENVDLKRQIQDKETATYGKTWYDEDVHDLISVESEFPAIVFDDALTTEVTLSCEPTVSPLNDNKFDFRISFDESDDEDYTVIYDKILFSYKIISVDDLKTDLENDNDKVNMPSFPSPKPTVSYFHDLDFFKDFENEFSAIVYNNALTSKLDFLTEPTVSPQHIDEFDLRDETSLSECDEEEQNVLYFNDLFPFNVIYPNDSKSNKDNDDDKIDIKHSLGGNVINTNDGAYAQRYQYGVSWGTDTAYQLPV